jgi:hypothetical protein
MTYETQGKLFKYVYIALGALFVMSLFLLVFMKGVMPFNTHLSWSDGSLVLTQSQAEPAVGKRVARAGSIEGQVMLYRVLDSYRDNGELYYRVESAGASGGEEVLAARSVQHVVVATIPVLGFWIHALGTPVGALVMLGVPLLTFALDLILTSIGSGFFRRIRVFMIRSVRAWRRERAVRREIAAATPAEVPEEDVYEEGRYRISMV